MGSGRLGSGVGFERLGSRGLGLARKIGIRGVEVEGELGSGGIGVRGLGELGSGAMFPLIFCSLCAQKLWRVRTF